jgi:hypothetical protein
VTAESGDRYRIYLTTRSPTAPLADRLVVIGDGGTYVGNYMAEPGRYDIEGADVVVRTAGRVDRIHFGPHGPPSRAVVGGAWRFFER